MISKKFKAIKNSKQLVKGNYYIRAVINCHGKFWFEIFQVIESPYIDKTITGSYNLVKLRHKGSSHVSINHVSDKIGHSGFGTRLFPYSSKVVEFLKKNSGSLRDFFFAIHMSKDPSEKDFDDQMDHYQFMKDMDDMMEEERKKHRG